MATQTRSRNEKMDELRARITAAAETYESRWTLARLRRLDADLYARFIDQSELWARALREGDDEEFFRQGEAMVRGWEAVAVAMLHVEEDAYVAAETPGGVKIVISDQKAVAGRFNDAIWLSPAEVAELLDKADGFRALVALKRGWPKAEVISNEERARREASGRAFREAAEALGYKVPS